ncbi:MAG: hypothetical protein KJS66_09065 [Acidobacteria bacterium]|nr:hypothetical protein [Acidobacteriota bacterium]
MSEAFAAAHGSEVADIIMEHLPPEGLGDLATKTDVATQGQLLRSDFETQGLLLRRDLETRGQLLRRDFETQGLLLRRDLETQMSALRSDLESQISTLRTELRADLATGFAQQLKWLVGTMVALFTVVSGLVSVLVVVAK